MSKEQLKALLEAIKADAGLQEKLKAAADNDAVVAIAKAVGFSISADDLNNAVSELPDGELEGVSGGNTGVTVIILTLLEVPLCWTDPYRNK